VSLGICGTVLFRPDDHTVTQPCLSTEGKSRHWLKSRTSATDVILSPSTSNHYQTPLSMPVFSYLTCNCESQSFSQSTVDQHCIARQLLTCILRCFSLCRSRKISLSEGNLNGFANGSTGSSMTRWHHTTVKSKKLLNKYIVNYELQTILQGVPIKKIPSEKFIISVL